MEYCGIHMEYCGIHMEYCGIHVESIWNDVEYHGVHRFHGINYGGFHLDSREIFHGILKFHGVSIWNEHGNLHQNGWALSQKYSIWNPWNPYGIGIHSTWNPPGMWGHSKDLAARLLATSISHFDMTRRVAPLLATSIFPFDVTRRAECLLAMSIS